MSLTIRPFKKAHCWRLEGVEVSKQYTKGFYRAKPDTDIDTTQSCPQGPPFAMPPLLTGEDTFKAYSFLSNKSNLEKLGFWQVEQLCLLPGYFC